MPTPPDLDAVRLYLRIPVGDADAVRDAEIAGALATEIANQKTAVRKSAFGIDPAPPAEPVAYPVDLAEALCRRVARNLALRGLPLAVLQASSEGGPMATPGKDPEIRRLEFPHRKLPSG